MKLPRLKEVREQKGLAPVDVCEAARIPLEKLEAIENGTAGVFPDTAQRIARALGVEVEDLRDSTFAARRLIANELKNADKSDKKQILKKLRDLSE